MSTTSKVNTLIDDLRARILSGEFGREGRLPSFRSLATEYNTTQETMNKTMHSLQAEGLLVSMGAKGVFVNIPSVLFPGLTQNFHVYLQQNLADPVEEYIDKPSIIKDAEVSKALNLPIDTLLVRRYKKQGAKNTIFRLEETFYPKSSFSDEAIEELSTNVYFDSIPEIKKQTGLVIKSAIENLVIRFPNSHEQDLLKVVRTNPIIEIKRVCYAADKKNSCDV